MHARRAEVADAINTRHRNPAYWPDIDLPASLTATTDPAAALAGADYLVLSIPAQSLRDNLAQWAPNIESRTVIVSLMKGIEVGSGRRARSSPKLPVSAPIGSWCCRDRTSPPRS